MCGTLADSENERKMKGGPMKLKSYTQKNVRVVAPVGRLDMDAAESFDGEFSKWIKDGENCFLIDMDNVKYVSSAGLRSVLLVERKLDPQQGKLALCNLHGVVAEVFNITAFSDIMPIYKSVKEALGDMSSDG